MDYCRKVNGSISAEHGVGQQKPAFLHYSKSRAMIQTMSTIKQALDPNHILNPYKMLPTTDSGLWAALKRQNIQVLIHIHWSYYLSLSSSEQWPAEKFDSSGASYAYIYQ